VSETKIKVLVAEDEVNLGQILSNFLSGRGCAVRTVTDGRAAVDALRAEAYDVALLDIVMPELDGLEVLKQVRTEADPPEVIIITGNGTIETAISAMKLGAYDYMSKPYRMAEIDVLVRRAWEKRRLARENVLLQSQLERAGGALEIETQYAPLRAVLEMIGRVAPSDSPVLITGESGTGKEVLARYVHEASTRSTGPFVALNCAALPRDLLEAELFGIERGVATGVEARAGRFELAHGGTLFLDEIGDMSLETQAKLLRVLQERTVHRLGGVGARPADARIVAATNRDMRGLLAERLFREDLFFRIATWTAELPPLRRRRADIPNLAAYFLAREGARSGVRVAGVSEAALERLVGHEWPGNVRQLENEMARAVLFLSDGELLDSSRLSPGLRASPPASGRRTGTLEDVLAGVERDEIGNALAACGQDVGKAAERLGLGRSTLYRRMRELGLAR
jgi:DNA-binding NtrC family response regulator